MPFYEFVCPNCDRKETFYVTMTDIVNYIPFCNQCKSEMKRIYTAPAIHLKGRGFYKTDYRKRKRR